MQNKTNYWRILLNGIIYENPVLVLVLGTCPTLATSTQAKNGIGMGIAATLVLLGSNLMISLLKNIIPKKVRIPCYITVIASFTTLVQMFVEAYFPDINASLGIYLPLIVVNCIILARAEMFASKNGPVASMVDAIGMGAGFTCALLIMGSIREILGSGTWFGMQVLPESIAPMAIFTQAPGGFFVFGVLMATVTALLSKKGKTPVDGCATCPSREACNQWKEAESK